MISNITLFKNYQKERTIKNRNLIVLNNCGLINKYVCTLKDKTIFTQEDLSQIGVLGLIKAVERFDILKGNQFSTFATYYIKGEISHYIRDKTSLFSGRTHLKRLNLKNCTDEDRQDYYNYYHPNSLNIKIGINKEEELINFIKDKELEETINLEELLSPLNDKEKDILISLYIEKISRIKISVKYQHCPKYISIIINRALIKIRRHHHYSHHPQII